ncbi:unnamed protein product [Ilex paraguariensis]|uniref:Plastid movement impaired 2 n=1 Tax=Ilex paraguariensis TaxID=185542 RepID=A0ABC8V082_9AQUA
MGNNIGGRKKAKVMKINGEIFKLKAPISTWDVVKDFPGHVLLESNSVKQYGIRAKPLEPQEELKPKKVYFLVQLPKMPEEKVPRRARSGVHMSAKDRLECLMLSRRSVSELSTIRPTTLVSGLPGPSSGSVQVKMRLPRAQMSRLVEESRDEAEVAEKLIDLYVKNADEADSIAPDGESNLGHRQVQKRPGLDSIREGCKDPEVM